MRFCYVCFLWLSFGVLFAGASDEVTLNTILASSGEDREAKIKALIAADGGRVDPGLSGELNAMLARSLDPNFNPDNRFCLARLAGQLHDTKALTFLINQRNFYQHRAVGRALSAFGRSYPYARAIIPFGKNAVTPLLDAVKASPNPTKEYVAMKVLDYIGSSTGNNDEAASPLIDYYEASDLSPTMKIFVIRQLKVISPVGMKTLVTARLANEQDPSAKIRLSELSGAIQ